MFTTLNKTIIAALALALALTTSAASANGYGTSYSAPAPLAYPEYAPEYPAPLAYPEYHPDYQPHGSAVDGYNVGIVRVRSGSFEQRGNGWVEIGASGRTEFTFKETGRDKGSVYLYDHSRNVRLTLDLHRDMVMYQGSPLYPITSVAH